MSEETLSVAEQWNGHLTRYYCTLKATSGCGQRGQICIDEEYKRIDAFVKEHPEYKKLMPKKHVCHDDGMGGFASGFAAFAGTYAASDW